MNNPIISLEGVEKRFGSNLVVKKMNLEIAEGEFLTLLGPSGCGKTTTLRMIAGFEEASAGVIKVEGERIEDKEPFQRNVNTVFQNYALFPHMTVFNNVAYGLTIKKVPKPEIQERVMEMLRLVQLEGFEKRKPDELSGGQKQRVAIARAIATNPKVLLCDEATSALDPNTTKSILQLLKQINRELGITVIVITHEMAVIEAICDRVAIIDKSHIAEVGKVAEIFSEPKSKIGRQLILGDAITNVKISHSRKIRIIFDGRESMEPVLANMILACKVPVNIMYASTRDVGGKAMGQMIIQLPEDEADAARALHYLKTVKIPFEEVRENDL